MLIKHETKVSFRMSGIEERVIFILESCFLRAMMRNSVLEELYSQTSRRKYVAERAGSKRYLSQSYEDSELLFLEVRINLWHWLRRDLKKRTV